MAVLQVEHLKYKYPLTTTLALDDLSFNIQPGEFIGVIGENGAGKSSLCQALVGLIPNFYKGAYGGKVLLDHREVAKTELAEVCKRIGIVFQNPFNQLTGAKLTVYEEIAFGLENMGLSRQEMIKRIDEALALLNITDYKNRHPFDLSGGQMQRVAIASIIAMKPEVIVLDEPTSQLDPQGSEEVFRAVEQLTKQKITIIMVEHKMEKIASFSDRVMLLYQGKLIDFDTPQKIFSRSDLESYGVNAPVYTRICRALDLKIPQTGLYPVTLEEATQVMMPLQKGGY